MDNSVQEHSNMSRDDVHPIYNGLKELRNGRNTIVALRERMLVHLNPNWRQDIPQQSGWSVFFAECPPPNFEAVPEAFEIADDAQIWPGRRNRPLSEAPEGAHICRAFDGLEPVYVRVVVLGQDPYPGISQATGRAFEDGQWQDRRPQELAKSLKPLMLAAFATQEDRADHFRAGQWSELLRDQAILLPVLGQYFDGLVGHRLHFTTNLRCPPQARHRSRP